MKNITQSLVDCFNNQDIEGMKQYWHDDITIYDMQTNKILISGINNVYQANKQSCLDKTRYIYANIIPLGNQDLIYKTFSHNSNHDITLVEYVDGKIKNAWHASFQGEKQ